MENKLPPLQHKKSSSIVDLAKIYEPKDNIKNNSYIKSKRENKILKNEDRDDINCDGIKVNKKNVSKNIDIKTKPDEDMIKTKKIKRRNQYLDEAKSKESFEEEEILKK